MRPDQIEEPRFALYYTPDIGKGNPKIARTDRQVPIYNIFLPNAD